MTRPRPCGLQGQLTAGASRAAGRPLPRPVGPHFSLPLCPPQWIGAGAGRQPRWAGLLGRALKSPACSRQTHRSQGHSLVGAQNEPPSRPVGISCLGVGSRVPATSRAFAAAWPVVGGLDPSVWLVTGIVTDHETAWVDSYVFLSGRLSSPPQMAVFFLPPAASTSPPPHAHAHTHSDAHSHTFTCTRTHTHTASTSPQPHVRTHTPHAHTHTLRCTLAHSHARSHIHMHSCTRRLILMHAHAHTYTLTHSRTRARTHAESHSHARTLILRCTLTHSTWSS